MKAGDRIKILSARGDSYEVGTVVEVLENSVKYKHDKIGGHFVVLKTQVTPLECDSCECDPCDCDWGMY